MKIKSALFFFFVFFAFGSKADVPGAAPRPSGSFAITNVSAFPEWRFYFGVGDSPIQQLTDSAVQVLAGGRGAPIRYTLYAQRISDSLRTRPLHYGCYDGHLLLKIDSIRLKDTSLVLSTQPKLLPEMEAVKESETSASATNWMLWIGVCISGGALLVFIFIWIKRKKKQVVTDSENQADINAGSE